MSYGEYRLTLIGYWRSYFQDYEKFRRVAYQSYLSQPWSKDKSPLPIHKYLHLPFVDSPNQDVDIERQKSVRDIFKAKLKQAKDGK
jgi:hypothetical protein